MKVYGKWLVVQIREGKRCIVTSGRTKKECEWLLQQNARPIDKNTWTNEDSVFVVEKNTKEYR